jgi:ppGpp synthetase/RelA/SpoT-type nucleotidyltranferase
LAEKGTTYEKLKEEFKVVFTQIEPLDKQTAAVRGQIQQNGAAFNQIVSQGSND